VSVLRRAYIEVTPDVSKFDTSLRTQLARQDAGGKAGKQLGGQLNRALARLDLQSIDVKADPKSALAAIGTTEARLQALSRTASTVEIKVRAEQALKEIGRFRKTLGDVGGDAAPELALSLTQRLGPLLAKIPIGGPMSVGLAAAAASAAPLLGAAVAGGIIGGAGIGGVVGGLKLAAKDERVQSAAKDLGDQLSDRLNQAGGAFVGPALAGLKEVRRALSAIDIEGILAKSSTFVQPLTAGVASAVIDLGEALGKLVDNAVGPIAAISDGIALIGKRAGEGMSSLADNSAAGADALRTLFDVVGSVTQSTFQLVNALTELYEINKAIGGDFGLQAMLKLTGGEMESGTFSARKLAGGYNELNGTTIKVTLSAEELKKKQEGLKAANEALATSQQGLQRTLDSLGGKNTTAARTSDALRAAMDNLYGAAIRNTDANEAYQASWDDLSSSVKTNKATLDINSAAGRANRDVLQGLLGSNNDLYLANIAAGQSVDSARKKHENRTAAIVKEADKLGFNEKKTRDLIKTYGQIPPRKATDLVVEGINQVVIELKRVYLAQRALAEGKTINAVRYEGTAAMRSLHTGGYTGDGGKYEPKGIVHGGEWVVNKETTAKVRRQAPGFLEELHATGKLPGYARGGLVAPVETSKYMRFPVDVSDSYVMPKALALSKVIPAVPSGGRTGPWIERAAKAIDSAARVISGFRPGARTLSGNQSLHALDRARDFSPSRKLAEGWDRLYGSRTTEAITPYQQFNRLHGRRHRYTGAVWNQHNFAGGNAHDHIAMDDGGFRMLQPGMNMIPNGTGKPEPIAGPAAMRAIAGDTIIVNIHSGVIVKSKRDAEDLVVEAVRAARDKRRI